MCQWEHLAIFATRRKDNKIYASITRMDIDGTAPEVVAHGIRNTVGFAWHPQTGKLWFTDNGGDMMGERRNQRMN